MNLFVRILLLAGIFSQTVMAQTQFGWAKQISGPGAESPEAVAFDQYSNLYLAGKFSGTADFDPGPGVFNIAANGINDIFVLKLDPSGNLLWVKTFGGLQDDGATALDVDFHGNVFVTGYFNQTVAFTPQATFTAPPDLPNAFVLELNTQGELMWARQLKSNAGSQGFAIKTDGRGNQFVTGYTSGETDFDPDSIGVQNVTAQGTQETFLLKLNIKGELLWAKTMRGSTDSYGRAHALQVSGGYVYLAGGFSKTVDFDPGVGEQLASAQNTDGFVQKLDEDGNLVWLKELDCVGNAYGFSLAIDAAGNVFTTGYFSTEIDFDPGVGTAGGPAAGITDAFVLKLDADGNYAWHSLIASQGREHGFWVSVSPEGDVYATGYFQDVVDFDPGTGVHTLTANGFNDLYVQILDNDGNFLDAWQVGSTGFETGKAVAFDTDQHLVLVGTFEKTVDVDPGADTYPMTANTAADAFILKQVGDWDYSGRVFEDLNGNLSYDPGEPAKPGILLGTKNQQVYTTTDYAGVFHIYRQLLPGDSLFAVPQHVYWAVSPSAIALDGTQDNLNFAMTDIFPKVRDICISVIEKTIFRPGFTSEIEIQVTNVGTVAVDSIPVRLKIVTQLNPPIEFFSSNPPPLTQSDDFFTWFIPSLDTTEMVSIRVLLDMPQGLPNGVPVVLSASSPIDDDAFYANNGSRVNAVTSGSLDPNDKRVTPEQVIPEAVDTSTLRYVIRFQNTGTYKADFVVIRDTLPADLDLSMLKILAASHPYTWRLFGDRVLEFRFDNINLPDSTSNEPESHGYAAFTVQPKNGLSNGTTIQNRAGIYFDYNAPVITNYAVFEVSDFVKTSEPARQAWLDFGLSPNPVAAFSPITISLPEAQTGPISLTIYDALGKKLREMTVPARERLVQVNGLAAGSYFVQLRAGKGVGGKGLLVR